MIHSGSLRALPGSGYRMLLLVKVGTVTLVLGTGGCNYRRAQPALGDDVGTARL